MGRRAARPGPLLLLPHYYFPENVEAGGLMTFGPDFSDRPRIRAEYAIAILRGASPGDLPVRLPSPVIAINLKTAGEQGIEFSRETLAIADVVME